MPEISIIFIPTPFSLDPSTALHSVLSSEFQDWELWLPEAILETYGFQDDRIRTFSWLEVGISKSEEEDPEFDLHEIIDRIVLKTKGRYLSWIDSSHYWHPKKIGMQHKILEINPNVGIAWNQSAINLDNETGANSKNEVSHDYFVSENLAVSLLGNDVLNGWSNALVRRSAWENRHIQLGLYVTFNTLIFASVDWFASLAINQKSIVIFGVQTTQIEDLFYSDFFDLFRQFSIENKIYQRLINALNQWMPNRLFFDWQSKALDNIHKRAIAHGLDLLYQVYYNATSIDGDLLSSLLDQEYPESKLTEDKYINRDLRNKSIKVLSDFISAEMSALNHAIDYTSFSELCIQTARTITLMELDIFSCRVDQYIPLNSSKKWLSHLAVHTEPYISVGIPVYNGEVTIAETIQSVLSQTFTNFELIIVDDGSTDRTTEIIQAIKDPRIRLLSFKNAGLAVSRNHIITSARGSYISFLDADDLWTKDKLADQYQALLNTPSAAVAYSFTDYIDGSSRWLRSGSHIIVNGDPLGYLLLTDFLENGSNALICRSACEQIGGFDENFSSAADWDFFLKLAMRYLFVCVPKPQILYRLTDHSMSSQVLQQERDCLQVLEAAFSSIPEFFQRLRPQSYSNLYLYLTYRALVAEPTPNNRKAALYFLQSAIRVNPLAQVNIDRFVDLLTTCTLYAHNDYLLPPTFQVQDLFELTHAVPYPLVSVIIPAYNAANTIGETIASVQAQTLRDWEMIVIDDGSTDETVIVVEAIGDPRIHIYRYPNAGQGESRNRGACHATGEFFAFLDADDLWLPDKLERMVKAIGEHPQAAVAYSWIDHIDENGNFLTRACDYTRQGYVYDKLLLSDFIAGGSNLMLWRGAFGMVGGFNPDFPPAEDRDMWLRLSEKFHFVAIEAPLLRYRQVPQSQSANVTRMERSQRRVIEAAFDRAPNNFPFTELPELLPYYKRQVLANTYKYLTFKQLDAPVDQASARIALRLFRVVLDHEPTLFQQHRYFVLKLWLRIWLATILSPPVMVWVLQRFRTFHRLHRDLLGYTRMSLRDLLPDDLRKRYAKLTDG